MGKSAQHDKFRGFDDYEDDNDNTRTSSFSNRRKMRKIKIKSKINDLTYHDNGDDED